MFVDLERHCIEVVHDAKAIERVSPWEVCFLMGVALLRAAEERLAFELPVEHRKALENAWRVLAGRANTETPPQIDVSSLGKSMLVWASHAAAGSPGAVGAGLDLLKAGVDAVRWSVPFGELDNALTPCLVPRDTHGPPSTPPRPLARHARPVLDVRIHPRAPRKMLTRRPE